MQLTERFDGQADGFDRRAGMPPDAARAVAQAVLDVARAGPGDIVVELGAGTGEIGRHLAAAVRYIGLDTSRAMLDVFRAKAPDAQVVEADADHDWPVADGAAAVVFGSRVAHLLDPNHLVGELGRVCRPGGAFLVGRVQRDPNGVKGRLRRHRRRLLHHLPAGDERTERLLDRLVAAGGAARLDPRPVATWTTRTSPAEVLAGWEATTEAGVLVELQRHAVAEFGAIEHLVESTEQYTLAGAVLPEEPWTSRC